MRAQDISRQKAFFYPVEIGQLVQKVSALEGEGLL